MNTFEIDGLNNYDDVIAYRDSIIDNYLSEGYVLMTDEYYSELDAPADENFDKVLAKIDINVSIKKWGKKILTRVRKSLSVGEFVAHYG